MSKKILLICFDTPYPDNYGGVVDIERKFKFFHNNGFKIDLICSSFDLERTRNFEDIIAHNHDIIDHYHIENIDVSFRKILLLFSLKPFSIRVREINFHKINFIQNHEYDLVLVEHLKSTHKIKSLRIILQNSSKFWLRMHNDEAEYYGNLMKVEPNILKKIFFLTECFKYKYYQRKILNNNVFDGFLYISSRDKDRLQNTSVLTDQKHILLPIYQEKITKKTRNLSRKIDFLYVGNLDLNDNFDALKQMILFLKHHGLENTKINIVGKCTGIKREQEIKTLFSDFLNIKFDFNVDNKTLDHAYADSKFFLNFSSNKSGVKTKLIDAINRMVPVISDDNGVIGSGYENIIWNKNSVDSKEIFNLISDENAYLEFYNEFEDVVIENSKKIDKIYQQWLIENYE